MDTNGKNNVDVKNPIDQIEKIKSLELRLMGSLRTIKSLEKQSKSKDKQIDQLKYDLEKKTKTVD
jgi:hypothetical protein